MQKFLNEILDSSHSPEWFRSYQKRALKSLEKIQLPSRKSEAWKYAQFSWVENKWENNLSQPASKIIDKQLEEFGLKKEHIDYLCVDGRFLNRDSIKDKLFHESYDQEIIKSNFKNNNFFDVLNIAALNDLLEINISSSKEIHIVFLSTQINQWHNINLNILLGDSKLNAKVKLSVIYPQSVLNIALNLNQSQNTKLEFLQWASPKSIIIQKRNISLDNKASYTGFDYNFESQWAHEQQILNLKEDACAQLSGLILPSDKQFDDREIEILHEGRKSKSMQQFYSVADDHGKAVFHGKAVVKPTAIGADARQLAHALMLSSSCQVFSRPELEIDIDDVQCQHGSSIGQLNKNALLYLRSRGIDYDHAKNMIICGFIEEVLQLLPEGWYDWMKSRVALHGYKLNI